jgi:hypothetical protein
MFSWVRSVDYCDQQIPRRKRKSKAVRREGMPIDASPDKVFFGWNGVLL